MRIVVFGAGGVGGYFGGRLAQAGHSVAFVARGAHLEALRRQGLRVESLAGDFVLSSVEATDDPEHLGAAGAVLLAVKAWQVPAAAAAMLPVLGPHSFVVPLQNGVEAADQLAAVVGEQRVVGGLCRIISHVAAPGVVRHVGMTPCLEIGDPAGMRSARPETLRAAFANCIGVAVVIPPDIEVAVWEKFLFIAPFAGVGALTQLTAGGMRADPEARWMLAAATAEVFSLARARGVPLSDDAVDRTLAFVGSLPDHATSSLQRDIAARRPSELESLSGAVVRLAAESGVPVHVHTRIHRLLAAAELRARGGSAPTLDQQGA
jgi:2-dehydropantoate 2-reductase